MKKKNVTYVSAAAVEQIISENGLQAIAQSGFLRVQVEGAPKSAPRLYVARTKTVGRVDLSGFTVDTSLGVVDLGEDSFCKVKQQVDFSRPAEEILATLANLCSQLPKLTAEHVADTCHLAQPKPEKKAKAPKAAA